MTSPEQHEKLVLLILYMSVLIQFLQRVALLEFPSFYEVDYEMDNLIDHHRDMRLDIDDMSYEVS